MRAYADRAALAVWLFGAADPSEPRMPADADRLLQRASEVVEGYCLAGYATNSDGDPTDAHVADWLSDAACAQVEFWLLVSEEHSVAGVRTGTLSVGGVSHNMPNTVAPRALAVLDRAGLRIPGSFGGRQYRRPLDLIGRTYWRTGGADSITVTEPPST